MQETMMVWWYQRLSNTVSRMATNEQYGTDGTTRNGQQRALHSRILVIIQREWRSVVGTLQEINTTCLHENGRPIRWQTAYTDRKTWLDRLQPELQKVGGTAAVTGQPNVVIRTCIDMLARQLSFHYQRRRLPRPEDLYSIGRQKFLCRWTTSLEQSTYYSATSWHGL